MGLIDDLSYPTKRALQIPSPDKKQKQKQKQGNNIEEGGGIPSPFASSFSSCCCCCGPQLRACSSQFQPHLLPSASLAPQSARRKHHPNNNQMPITQQLQSS